MSQGTFSPPPPRQFRRPPPTGGPVPTPGPAPGTLLHDSWIHTKLHNKIPRTITREGLYECRASGDPRIQVNPDGTFSLICNPGHGRIYGYIPNYNAYMILEAAFWNQASGQNLSLKIRSRHNEPDPCDHRFGGYGFHVDRGTWGSKTEPCHNNHTDSAEGRLPFNIQTGQFFQTEFSVKDEGTGVRQIGKVNGAQLLNRVVRRQPAPVTLFQQRSYWWVRQNNTSPGEIRIKRIRLYAI